MLINEAIRKIIKIRNMNFQDMATALQVSSANQVSSKLMNENWTVKSILSYLNILDYEIILQPKNNINEFTDVFRITLDNNDHDFKSQFYKSDNLEKEVANQVITNVFQTRTIAEEILGLKELVDTCVITQEEFEAKKKQLLGL